MAEQVPSIARTFTPPSSVAQPPQSQSQSQAQGYSHSHPLSDDERPRDRDDRRDKDNWKNTLSRVKEQGTKFFDRLKSMGRDKDKRKGNDNDADRNDNSLSDDLMSDYVYENESDLSDVLSLSVEAQLSVILAQFNEKHTVDRLPSGFLFVNVSLSSGRRLMSWIQTSGKQDFGGTVAISDAEDVANAFRIVTNAYKSIMLTSSNLPPLKIAVAGGDETVNYVLRPFCDLLTREPRGWENLRIFNVPISRHNHHIADWLGNFDSTYKALFSSSSWTNAFAAPQQIEAEGTLVLNYISRYINDAECTVKLCIGEIHMESVPIHPDSSDESSSEEEEREKMERERKRAIKKEKELREKAEKYERKLLEKEKTPKKSDKSTAERSSRSSPAHAIPIERADNHENTQVAADENLAVSSIASGEPHKSSLRKASSAADDKSNDGVSSTTSSFDWSQNGSRPSSAVGSQRGEDDNLKETTLEHHDSTNDSLTVKLTLPFLSDVYIIRTRSAPSRNRTFQNEHPHSTEITPRAYGPGPAYTRQRTASASYLNTPYMSNYNRASSGPSSPYTNDSKPSATLHASLTNLDDELPSSEHSAKNASALEMAIDRAKTKLFGRSTPAQVSNGSELPEQSTFEPAFYRDGHIPSSATISASLTSSIPSEHGRQRRRNSDSQTQYSMTIEEPSSTLATSMTSSTSSPAHIVLPMDPLSTIPILDLPLHLYYWTLPSDRRKEKERKHSGDTGAPKKHSIKASYERVVIHRLLTEDWNQFNITNEMFSSSKNESNANKEGKRGFINSLVNHSSKEDRTNSTDAAGSPYHSSSPQNVSPLTSPLASPSSPMQSLPQHLSTTIIPSSVLLLYAKRKEKKDSVLARIREEPVVSRLVTKVLATSLSSSQLSFFSTPSLSSSPSSLAGSPFSIQVDGCRYPGMNMVSISPQWSSRVKYFILASFIALDESVS